MKPSAKVIVGKIKPEIEKILAQKGIELFDITLLSERSGMTLRIYIDTEKGAGIDDCTEASRAVSAYLDSDENIVPLDKYSLEVSTPGLERPLRTEGDFVRFTGKKCKILTREKDASGRKSYTGVIDSASEGVVRLNVEKESQIFDIPIENISKASLVVEF
jgi:ribosome maturation factor RimP